jgi:hypothetical protein
MLLAYLLLLAPRVAGIYFGGVAKARIPAVYSLLLASLLLLLLLAVADVSVVAGILSVAGIPSVAGTFYC